MGVIGKPDIEKLLADGELIIESLVPEQSFDSEKQITEDSIDLRLGVVGLQYKDTIKEINTLFEKDLQGCFEKVELPISGYKLYPGQVLFTSTLEAVCLATSKYIGRLIGRSTFARYGLSIHCNQPKFPPGLAWAFPLQIVNHNNIPIVIYPYTYIAQLQIETTSGEAISYDGKYDRDITLHPPKIDQRELESINKARSSPSMQMTMMTEHLEKMRETFRKFEERDRQRSEGREHPIMLQNPKHSKRKNIIFEMVLGTVSLLSFGICGNLLSNPEPNHWKNVACGLLLIIGVIFFGALIALRHFSNEYKWGGLD